MAPLAGNALLVTVSFASVTPGGVDGWPLLERHPLHAAHDIARTNAILCQLSMASVVRLVHDGLRALPEVEAVERAALEERDRAEEVPRHAPGRRRVEEAPEWTRAERQQHEEQDGVVVREAVAE